MLLDYNFVKYIHAGNHSEVEDAWQIGWFAVRLEKSKEWCENLSYFSKALCHEKNSQHIKDKVALIGLFYKKKGKASITRRFMDEILDIKIIFLKEWIFQSFEY